MWGKGARKLPLQCYSSPIHIRMAKGLLRNLGLVLIFAGVFILIVCALTHQISNTVLGCALACLLVGLVSYIVINKKMAS